jgi:hypothetical protein
MTGLTVASFLLDPNSGNKTVAIPVKADASELFEESIWTGIEM